MSTLSKDIADRAIKGEWPEDRLQKVVKYINGWGEEAYGATFFGQDHQKYLRPSPYIKNPEVYWEIEGGAK